MAFEDILKTVAPWLGAALTGPVGLATMAATTIASKLGLSDATVEGVKTALAGATPEQMLALKNSDNDFQLKMKELGFDNLEKMEKIAADDRASARDREVKVGDHTPRNLAYAITTGFFGILFALMFLKLDDSTSVVLNVMLGSLGTAWINVMSYYFGSTAGSARTKELLAGATPTGNVKG